MTVIRWLNGVSGNWSNASMWQGGTIPGAGDDASINDAGSYTVTVDVPEASRSVTLDSAGAELAIRSSLSLTGTVDLLAGALTLSSNGTIRGGTVVDGGSGFVFSGGTLDGVTYDGAVDLTAQSASLWIGAGGLAAKGANGTGDGTVVVGSGGNYNSEQLYFLDSQTIDHATIDLAGYNSPLYQYTSYGYYYAGSGGQVGTLTLGAHLVVDQTGSYDTIGGTGYGGGVVVNQGTINASSGSLTINPTRFANQGSIAVSGGDSATINAATFSNTGTMSVSGNSTLTLTLAPGELGHVSVAAGSTLVLAGSFATADLANLNAASGAVVKVTGTLNNAGATLSVGTGAALPALTLSSNGTIRGGTVVDGGSGFVFSGGTLDGVTYDGAVDLTAQSASLWIGAGGLAAKGANGTGDGTVVVGSGGNYNSEQLYFLDSQTIDHATIDLAGYNSPLYQYTSYGYYYAGSGGQVGTLTLGAHLVVDQTGSYDAIGGTGYGGGVVVNQGTINASSGSLTINPTRFANQGSIAVSGGDSATINAATFSNTGTMSVSGNSTLTLTLAPGELGHVSVAAGSTLVLAGSFATADLANLNAASGAVVKVTGTLNNAGATLSVGTGAALPALTLSSNGTIRGGTVVDGGSGFVFSGGTLDGVTYDGAVDLTAQSASLWIGAGGLAAKGANGTGDGTVVVGSGGNYNSEQLYFLDSQTIDHATIDLAGYNSPLYQYTSYGYYYAGSGGQVGTLTLGAHLVVDQTGSYDTIGGTGYGGGVVVNQGTINASSGSLTINPTRFANQGSIAVSGGDSATINAATFSNTGTMSVSGNSTLTLTLAPGELGHVSVAAGSTLVLAGSFATADLANLNAASGAVVKVTGTLNNAGATLSVGTGAALPALTLSSNGTIRGGTVVDGGSGFVFSGGTLDGVTYDGAVDLTAQSASLWIGAGGLAAKGANGTGDGTVVVGSGGNYNSEQLYFLDSQTIDHATIDLAGYNSPLYQYTSYGYYYAGSGGQVGTLTLGAHLVVDQTGSYDTIGGTGYGGGVVVNQGTINASSGSLTINPTRFANQGSIAVSGGDSATINAATFSNTGTMSVSGNSTLTLTLAPGELGHVSVAAGSTLVLAGSFATADLANLNAASGAVVKVTGTLNNAGATLSVGTGAALPALTLSSNGTIRGGTVVDGGSGFVFSGGTLDGVTYDGAVDLTAQSASLWIGAGGLAAKGANGTGDGTVVVGSGGNYNSEQLYFLDSQTIDHATIDLAGYNSPLYQYTSYGYYYAGSGGQVGTLTLGAHLVVDQTGSYDAIGGTGYGGGVVVNQGTINASSGSLTINPTRFANQGSIAVSGGDSATINAATFSNFNSGTLTDGTYSVAAGSTLQISSSIVTTLAADLTLAGAGSTLQSDYADKVEGSLTRIATNGALRILAGRTYTTAGVFTVDGLLQLGGGGFNPGSLTIDASGTLEGFGSADIENNGIIDAEGGQLVIAGDVTGTGSAKIGAGATLELGGADAQPLTFAGSNAMLKLDQPTGFTGTISGFAAGDAIDFGGKSITVATLANVTATSATLRLTLSGGTVVNYALLGDYSGDIINLAADGLGTGTILKFGGAQPPTLTNAGNTVTFTQGGPAVVVDATLGVVDVTSTIVVGATVSISDGLLAGDTLGFTAQPGITGSYNAVTGSLTLTGAASPATYATVLDSVSFSSSSVNPTNFGADPTRTITWLADNGGGAGGASVPVTSTIDVTPVIQPPVLANSYSAGYIEGGAAVAVDPSLAISDLNSLVITGAQVAISAGLQPGDSLNFTNQSGITGTFAGGVLTLSGNASLADYQAALRSVTYSSSNGDLTVGGTDMARTLSWRVTNAGGASNVLSSALGISLVAPVLAHAGNTVTYTDGGAPVAVDGTLTVTDSAATTLSGATVTIDGGYHAGDVLGFTAQPGITGTYAAGKLTLSGDASIAAYQAALGSVTYSSTSADPIVNGTDLTRKVAFSATNGNAGSAVVHSTIDLAGFPVIVIYNLAAGSVSAGPIDFGTVHVGDVASAALHVSNTATPPAERLDASAASSAPAQISTGGTVHLLQAGSSDTTSLVVGLVTTSDGAKSATVTVALQSDGTGTSGAGLTTLASRTLSAIGTVYALAVPNFDQTSINLGAARIGDPTLDGTITLTNGAVADAFQEQLVYEVQGSIGTLASGSDHAITLSLATGTAGALSVTAAVDLTSTGVGTSLLADTSLGSVTLTGHGKIYAPAVASYLTALEFGIVHVGDIDHQTLTLSNTATGALTDTLAGGVGSLSDPAYSALNTLGGGIAAGGSGSVSLALDTANAGTFNATATIALFSHDPDLADRALNTPAVALTGTVDLFAAPVIRDLDPGFSGGGTSYTYDFGTIEEGGLIGLTSLSVLNDVLAPADDLGGSFTIISGDTAFQNVGFSAVSHIGAGVLQGIGSVELLTGTVGQHSETIEFDPTSSNASGYSGSRSPIFITIKGEIDAAATTGGGGGGGTTSGGTTGGSSTGNTSTGDTSTGATSTGGTSTGGASTGGTSTGGTSTGGTSTGGTSTGGTSTGGTSTGGTSTGGTSTGGTSTGGTSTGGTSTGGTSTGGTSTGGTSTGGTSTGGTSTGGGPSTGGTPPPPNPPQPPPLPPPGSGPPGSANPDPHMNTFDGLHYEFQTVGEFVLAKSTAGDGFEVQVRLAAPNAQANRGYTIVSALAIQVGSDRVTIDSERSQAVWINGQPTTLAGYATALAGGTLYQSGNSYEIILDSGESIAADVSPGYGITATTRLANGAAHGSVEGLLGNYNGVAAADLSLADGTVLSGAQSDATIYGAFADSWRVTQATSLLDYGAGQTTDTFTDRSYPKLAVDLASFPTDAVAAATALAQQAGITDPGLLYGAVYDYLLTSDTRLITNESNLQQQGVTTTTLAPVTPAVRPQSAGVFAAHASQVEAASGATSVTFTAYRTGDDLSAPLTLDYLVVAPDGGYLGASDLGGSLPTGSVTLAANQTSTTFTVQVPNGIGARARATLQVALSDQANVPVIAPFAMTTLVNHSRVAGPPPVVSFQTAQGLTPIAHVGDIWTSTVALRAGRTVSNLEFAIGNAATGLADSLGGYITASTSTNVQTSVSPSFAGLTPGGRFDAIILAPNTSAVGNYSETITLVPFDTNATGYSAVLATQKLVVDFTVYPLAVATINTTSPIHLGPVRIGTVDRALLSISNTATGSAESLDVVVGHTEGAATGSGSITQLAAGATDETDISVGIDTSTAGVKTGSVTIGFASDGIGVDGLGATALVNQIVQVTGTVYQAAVPLLPSHVTVHVGDLGHVTLSVANTAPPGATSENLIATGLAGTGVVTASGSTGDITPGQTISAGSGAIALDFSTAQAGTIAGGGTIALQSDGTGIDGLGTVDLASAVVGVVVDNYATLALLNQSTLGSLTHVGDDYTLDLGLFARGAGNPSFGLTVANIAAGVADTIGGTFQVGGNAAGAFTNSGLAAFTGLGATVADSQPTITLSTTNAGTFTETIMLNAAASNDSGYVAQLPATLHVIGTVAAASTLSITGAEAGQATSDQTTIHPFANIVVSDTAGATEMVSVTVSAIADGSISNLSGGTYDASGGVYAVTGSQADVTAALDGLVFTPTPFQAAAGAAVTTGFTVTVASSTGASASDATTTVVATAASTIDIAARGTLVVPGAASGQSIRFLAATGLLVLDAPTLADLTVLGFTGGDHIDLLGVDPTTATPLLAAGTLTLSRPGGGGTIRLGLPGDYTGKVFALSADGHGGAELSVATSTQAPAPHQVVTLGSGDANVTVSGYQSTITSTGTGSVIATLTGLSITANLGDGDNVITVTGGATGSNITAGDGNNLLSLKTNNNHASFGSGSNAVSMTGFNNVVSAGDGDDGVTGGAGHTQVTLGGGTDRVDLGGWGNTVRVGDGDDTIAPGDGGAVVVLGDGDDTVSLRGYGNTVTGGNGKDTVRGGRSDNAVTLGDGDDIVTLNGPRNVIKLGNGTNVVTGGSGQDRVTVGGGASAITLGGTGNVVTGGNGRDQVEGSTGSTLITLGDGDDTVQAGGNGNTVRLGGGADTVTLSGQGNVVVAGNGRDSVAGGTDHNTITLGSGDNTVKVTGWVNTISLAGGVSQVDAGLGTSTVTVSGGTLALVLRGHGDVVFLHGDTQATITDTSKDLSLTIDSADVAASVTGFRPGGGAVLHAVGLGFTDAAQVLGALRADGHGGTLLNFGTAGHIDFTGLAPSALHAGNFVVS